MTNSWKTTCPPAACHLDRQVATSSGSTPVRIAPFLLQIIQGPQIRCLGSSSVYMTSKPYNHQQWQHMYAPQHVLGILNPTPPTPFTHPMHTTKNCLNNLNTPSSASSTPAFHCISIDNCTNPLTVRHVSRNGSHHTASLCNTLFEHPGEPRQARTQHACCCHGTQGGGQGRRGIQIAHVKQPHARSLVLEHC